MRGSVLVRKLGVPLAEKLAGMPVSKYRNEYMASQWLTPDEIEQIRNQKLQPLIQHAYETVPMYQNALSERGITPSDIRTLDDLAKLPVLTKETIRENYPSGTISRNYRRSQLIEASSSGSTGEPFRYVVNKLEKTMKWAAIHRSWGWAGYELGDKMVSLTVSPHRVFKKNRFLQFLEARCSGVLGLPATELQADKVIPFIEKIIQFRPKVVRGYSSTLYYLAQSVVDSGLHLKLSAACTTGETLHDYQRELMESAFGCKVYDGYGGEGMEIAAQCGHGSGYHINAENVIVEILDEGGRPCEPGVEGQIVLTDLNRYSMPFIRYNIQDLGVLSSETCACGRGLPMLERISGRLTDVGITPSGKLISSYFFSILFRKVVPRIKQFQVVQEQRDSLTIYVVPGEGFEEVREYLLENIQAGLGSEVTIEIKTVDEIPLARSGKRRLFISNCGIKPVGLTGEDG